MEFKYDPMPIIFEKGDPFTKLCVLEMVDLWNAPPGNRLILDLLKTQRKDGGFPSQIDPNVSGVKETGRSARLLLKCGMPKDGLALTSCIKFLLKHQTEDGGFRENPKLSIPGWMTELSNQKGVTWLTADMVDVFREFGQENAKACQKAINWLRRMELPEGGWAVVEEDEQIDPDSSAQITFLMKDLLGDQDTLYKRGLTLFEQHLDQMAQDAKQEFHIAKGQEEENEVYHLTHLLGQSFLSGKRGADAGYDINDHRVKKIAEAIMGIQREDGGFKPYWSQESDPLYSGLVLRIFLWIGAMEKEKIKSMIQNGVSVGK
ncbi:MAG: prenyltransferase/squalene oxidase repeat-containing protein [Candidatus Zixiibacteriota bacterium]